MTTRKTIFPRTFRNAQNRRNTLLRAFVESLLGFVNILMMRMMMDFRIVWRRCCEIILNNGIPFIRVKWIHFPHRLKTFRTRLHSLLHFSVQLFSTAMELNILIRDEWLLFSLAALLFILRLSIYFQRLSQVCFWNIIGLCERPLVQIMSGLLFPSRTSSPRSSFTIYSLVCVEKAHNCLLKPTKKVGYFSGSILIFTTVFGERTHFEQKAAIRIVCARALFKGPFWVWKRHF